MKRLRQHLALPRVRDPRSFRPLREASHFWGVVLSGKVLLIFVALGAVALPFNKNQFQSAFAHLPETETLTLASRFSTWDIAHYLRLSKDGYRAGSNSCAFYPLWPAMIHAAALAIGGRRLTASMLLTNILSLLGFVLFYRLAERHCDAYIARDSLILMLAFPGALFFAFPYSEALYFVILMLFFWGLELERWSWTAAAGFLLPLGRPLGIFVVLPLAWFFYEHRRSARAIPGSDSLAGDWGGSSEVALSNAQPPGFARLAPASPRNLQRLVPWFLILCPLLGYAAYFGVMDLWTGNPFEGFEAQRFFPNSPSIKNMFNLTRFTNALLDVNSLDGMMDGALDRIFFLLFLAVLPLIYGLNKTWFFYTLPAGLVPALSSWFMSYRRHIIVLFPVFIVLAQVLAKTKSRSLFWYYVVLLAALQAWAVTQFVNFKWAG